MTNDQSVHPVRLLARILRHPELRRSLFSMVEHNGLKLQAQDISIKEYPGYVLLAVILDRLKTSSGPVIRRHIGSIVSYYMVQE